MNFQKKFIYCFWKLMAQALRFPLVWVNADLASLMTSWDISSLYSVICLLQVRRNKKM